MTNQFKLPTYILAMGLAAFGVACGGEDDTMTTDTEVITTVNVTLTDSSNNTITGSFMDLDGDGGDPGMTMDLDGLVMGTTYTMTIQLLDETDSSDIEDITEEIQEEDDEHQFFFVTTGNVISVNITDTDANNLPVGLESEVTADAMGPGTLQIVLKHLPPLGDGTIQKTGTNTINDGDTDIDLTLNVTVQ